MTLITTEKLLRIAPNLPRERAEVKVKAMNELLPQYEIDTLDEFEEYLANVLHETGGFRLREESLNYRPDRLVAIWPRRFSLAPAPGRKLAADFAHNPRKLANEVYNGRMGNRPGSNDGWDFRGGGDPQLTGRETYTLFTVDSNRRFGTKLTAQQWAERVRTDDYWSTAAGGWFFKWKGLHTLAVSDNIVELRRPPIHPNLIKFYREMNLHEYPDTYYVFSDKFHPGPKRQKRVNATNLWKKLVWEELGIHKYMYSLKHAGADDLIEAGVDESHVVDHLGHSQKFMTRRYTLKGVEQAKQAVMKANINF